MSFSNFQNSSIFKIIMWRYIIHLGLFIFITSEQCLFTFKTLFNYFSINLIRSWSVSLDIFLNVVVYDLTVQCCPVSDRGIHWWQECSKSSQLAKNLEVSQSSGHKGQNIIINPIYCCNSGMTSVDRFHPVDRFPVEKPLLC